MMLLTKNHLAALSLIDSTRSRSGLTDRAEVLIGRFQADLRTLGLIDYAPSRPVAWKVTEKGRWFLRTKEAA